MRTRTLLRSSSALWAFPFTVGLTLFYYVNVTSDAALRQDLGYAPTLVSAALQTSYALAYGVAAALGAWEGGRLARGAVWELAPARSRYAVAAQALAPVVALAWLMLLLPVSLALIQGKALPAPSALGPLLLGLLLSAAHAVVGFAAARHLPRVIVAPVMAVAVWLVVATSRATSVPWRRHTLGQYPTRLVFGETATWTSLAAQALPTLGVALAVALLWVPGLRLLPRLALGAALLAACVSVAYSVTRDWGTHPPLATGQVAMRCAGEAPRVCMPQATARDVHAVREEVASALTDLVDLGIVPRAPDTVTDSLADGRYARPSTPETWRLGLTTGERQGTVRYRVVDEALHFPCSRPEPRTGRLVMLWAAERTGVAGVLEEFLRGDPYYDRARGEALRAEVAEVLETSPAEQVRWYRRSLAAACGAEA
ncbi:hypothetical protein RM780_03685 [Streptomyces sp. DSM 44917]|uniref:ABC transporter permease n=1 Tax=Streptomyces boetiae TaxID=3075541 RepID=A0ABU2L3D6_9ACTN|nr:hypothetical protein [Streptomyces sp. DSM 44917]MDT0306064.1 hypothetical protein [Streptomyces sp. DSM 44917]